MFKYRFITLVIFPLCLALQAQGQMVYVTDQIQVGLHADKSLQSPIVKLVVSGTPLELVKEEDDLSFVRETGGTGGWVDNSYISQFSSAAPRLQEAEQRIQSLEASLTNRSQGQAPDEIANLTQQLEVQRNRSGELARENELLRREIAANNPDSLYEKIQQLSSDNRQLEDRLANLLETMPSRSSGPQDDPGEDFLTARNIMIASGIILVLGIGLGIFIMDYFNRKRHGGFRV